MGENITRTEIVEGFNVFKKSKSAERQPKDEDQSVIESVQQKKEQNKQLEVLSFFLFCEKIHDYRYLDFYQLSL